MNSLLKYKSKTVKAASLEANKSIDRLEADTDSDSSDLRTWKAVQATSPSAPMSMSERIHVLDVDSSDPQITANIFY